MANSLWMLSLGSLPQVRHPTQEICRAQEFRTHEKMHWGDFTPQRSASIRMSIHPRRPHDDLPMIKFPLPRFFLGLHPCEDLLPAFVSAWLHGPPSATTSAHDDVSREQHSAWRRHRQSIVVQAGQRIGALPDPVAAMQQYAARIALAAPIMGNGGGGPVSSSASPALDGARAQHVAAAARQAALAECCVLRDVLLVSGLMARTRAAGTTPLDGPQLSRLESVLIPQLSRRLQRAAMAYWLTSTPASSSLHRGGAGGADLSTDLPLQNLTLGGRTLPQSLAAGGRGAGGTDVPRALDCSLASKLIMAAVPSLGAVDGLLRQPGLDAAATRLVLWLQADNDNGGGSRHMIELGFSLFSQREHAALLPLARLAVGGGSGGAATSSGAPEFLTGLGLVCKLQADAADGKQDVGREAAIADATGCFLRAVASLSSGGCCL